MKTVRHRVATDGHRWSGQTFYSRSINVVFWRFFARSGSIKRVLTQLTLPQRSCVGQPEGPEVAPPTVFNGRNCIEVCSVGSGISSAAIRYYCKGHFCDQFFTKFDDTE